MKPKRTSDEDRQRQERALADARHLRELAEKAQADLDRRKQQRESA